MPGLLDDAIIKNRTLPGMLKALVHEAKEVEKHGLLADCDDLDQKLHPVYVQFRDTLLEVTDEAKARVTKKVLNP